ncbi:sulfotransferase [Alteriqipengyuania sp. WL0013]|uniref:tetratricopeptide repeat-containing sulfotransferase family protein n=1 Tax=Alteriqipengyuania sp. WL0013 TaxID=3110773 RepID=UPI002D037D82|nr:sulfotransferase [Alteriqipengyuania sp. WL0013]MEB3415861.1 sulfotransferase [Alteriqipengyuania sp. WL0013]
MTSPPATNSAATNRVLAAVEALKRLDRDGAVALLREEVREGPPNGERWQSIGRLAKQIGAVDIQREAARRFAATPPPTLSRLLYGWGELVETGRSREAREQVARLAEKHRQIPQVQHFLGTQAVGEGKAEEGASHFRAALAQKPAMIESWSALAMTKTFAPGDPDLAALEKLRSAPGLTDPMLRSRLLYTLGKAYHDCRDFGAAFEAYSEGAALRRGTETFDYDAMERQATQALTDFTPERMARLRPSGHSGSRAIFVNGLPRSGSTLTETILTAHPDIADGGEINLLRPALIPVAGETMIGAHEFEAAMGDHPDPWGTLARTYEGLLAERFGPEGRIVDKTLQQSLRMGLLLHTLPDARVLWMRRSPEDTALSCFRTYFTAGVPWSWSLADIGRVFALEDRLFAHWVKLFPERIMTVPYEELVSAPDVWIPKIADHAGVSYDRAMAQFHRQERVVRTASAMQVREPMRTDRVGQAEAYGPLLDEFRAAYAG